MTTMLPTVERLRELLADMREHRPILSVPYVYEFEGETWTVACDGICLLALRGDRGAEPWAVGAPDFKGVILPVPVDGWRAIDAGALVEFGKAAAPDPASCKHCGGTGMRPGKCEECDGSGEVICICPNCDDDHYTDCKECDGKKLPDVKCERCFEPREVKGRFGIALVNRANIYKWLSWLEADAPVEVAITAADRAIRFRGENWFALMMPMRGREADEVTGTIGEFNGWLVPA